MLCVYGSPLYQWDINRQLRIDTVDVHSNFMIHCCHRDDTSTLVVEPIFDGDVILVNIPNILLQRHGNIRVYVVVEGDTIYDTSFYVMARPKPDDYVYTETEILDYRRYEKIAKEQNAQSQAAATAAAASSAAAKQSETAAKESETNARECADSADVANAAAVAARDESVAARDASVSAAAASEQFRKDTADIKAAAEKSIAIGLDAALSDISTSRYTAVNDIMDASDVAVGNVREEGVAQTNSIANAGENAVGEVTAVGEQVRGEVVSAGQAKLDEIAGAKRGAVLYEVQVLEDTQKAQARSNISAAGAIVCSASGENITITDSSDQRLEGLKVFGKSTQGGTPTPSAPVPITSVGDKGEVNVRITGKNLFGGDALADKLVELSKATIDEEAGTVFFRGVNTTGDVYFSDFKPNTRYTFIFKCSVNTAGPISAVVAYTDGSTSGKIQPKTGETTTVVFVSAAGKSIKTFQGSYYSDSTIYYNECGIFEGVLTADDFEPYKPEQTITIPTPNGLPGVPTASGGNYTDDNGQQWVCDEIDLARGMYLRRIEKKVLNGSESWKSGGSYCSITIGEKGTYVEKAILCDKFVLGDIRSATTDIGITVQKSSAFSADVISLRTDVDSNSNPVSLIAWLADNNLTVYCALAEPIEIPLAEEELDAYRAVHTNKPNTVVSNDEGAGMEVSYAADTKLYIDNKFAELSAAILNNA